MALKLPTYTLPLVSEPALCGPDDPTSRQVGPVARKALGVILAGAAGCADLGGSSKFSRGALEDRRGEGFRVNSC